MRIKSVTVGNILGRQRRGSLAHSSLAPGRGVRTVASAVTDSRVAVPWLPPRCVSRPRLLAPLDRAADVPLTLVCAGPGAGKTVLLADWVRKVKARVAWITPAPADAEPRRFWRLLESALINCDDTG